MDQHELGREDAPPPVFVSDVQEKASGNGFALSCEPIVGRFLALLAAKTPIGGRVLELGTGAGVGLAWILHGLGSRTDVAVFTVEHDRGTLAIAQMTKWPSYVRFLYGDAEALLPELGLFDLVFADAEGGKWTGLDLTIGALKDNGVLVVDDMDVSRYEDSLSRATIAGVGRRISTDPGLISVELPCGSGIVLGVKRMEAPTGADSSGTKARA